MSHNVSVFVRDIEVPDVRKLLRDRLDMETAREEGPAGTNWVGNVFGVGLSVRSDHELEDDQGISFSRYPLQVSFTLYAGRIPPQSGAALCRALAYAFAAVARASGAECLIVAELQRVLRDESDAGRR